MKPILSYYGGKQRIASRIVELIRTIPHKVYAEPFAGGAAVLFAKGRPHTTNTTHYREAINDVDERIVTLYRVCQEQEGELLHLLKYTPYSQSEYRKASEILRGEVETTDLRRAWATVVSTRQGFAKKMFGGWGTSVSVTGSNDAMGWATYLDALPDILARFRGVFVACEDALRFIERWDSPDTLFYCDPPYPNTCQGHYAGYTLDDWQALCDAIDRCKGSYILSNYPQEIEPQTAQQRIELDAVMCAAKDVRGEKRTEVLWVCNRSGAVVEQSKMWE
jgi:DNA adenine methylase